MMGENKNQANLMADQDTLPPKVEKYFFDQHNFDEPDESEEPEEELPPPPPTFSEEELEQAKKQSFEKGRNAGLQEATESRENAVADVLNTVTARIDDLFAAEQRRAELYEAEAVHLARTIFENVFPVMNKAGRLDEITDIIVSTLESQRDDPDIQVFVHPDFVDGIQQHLKSLEHKLQTSGQISVKADENLKKHNCRLKWSNGGAERDLDALVEKISASLAQTLADKPRLGDNETGNKVKDKTENKTKTKTEDQNREDTDNKTPNNDTAPAGDNSEPSPPSEPENGDTL